VIKKRIYRVREILDLLSEGKEVVVFVNDPQAIERIARVRFKVPIKLIKNLESPGFPVRKDRYLVKIDIENA
jgi:hypothetical protein